MLSEFLATIFDRTDYALLIVQASIGGVCSFLEVSYLEATNLQIFLILLPIIAVISRFLVATILASLQIILNWRR